MQILPRGGFVWGGLWSVQLLKTWVTAQCHLQRGPSVASLNYGAQQPPWQGLGEGILWEHLPIGLCSLTVSPSCPSPPGELSPVTKLS